MPEREVIEDPRRPKLAPPELAGLWIAWSEDQCTVIAQGRTLEEARNAAVAAGAPDALLERVRRPDEILVGRL